MGPSTVFNDLNGDGFQDDNEPGLANVTIMLYQVTDDTVVFVASAETDENGVYEFSDLTPGSFYATVLNTTYYFSPVVEGGNQVTPNEDDEPNGNTPIVGVTAGEAIEDWNVGLFATVTVGNRIWLDENGNGVRESNEVGFEGINVTLVDESGSQQVQESDSDGSYLFTGLPPNTYSVTFDVPEGYYFSPSSPLSDTIDKSDPDAGDYATSIDSSGSAASVELQSGAIDLSFDAGVYVPIGVGGTVFLDLNADGIRDANETGAVKGVTLVLYDTTNEVDVTEIVTSFDGSYNFPLVPPGIYQVKLKLSGPLDDYSVSPVAEGGNAFDPNFKPAITAPVTITSGFDAGSLFLGGLYQGVRSSLYVWDDANGNGIIDTGEGPYTRGATIKIYDLNSSDSSTLAASGPVESDGRFSYVLTPGSYTFEVVILNDDDTAFSLQNQGSDDTLDSDVDASGKATITVVSGDEIKISAGVTSLPQVSNCVFLDSNGNGFQDDGEPPLSNVGIELYHANDTRADSTTSAENCSYEFIAPGAGDYYISVSLPVDFVLSPIVDGGNQIATNDDDGSHSSPVVSLTLGSVQDNWNVGMYLPVSIGNRVWNDLNGNGIQDSIEPGIEGILVRLNDEDGLQVNVIQTDESGNYLFEGMSPGNYSVAFELPSGYVFTIPAAAVVHVDGSLAYEDVTSDADRDTGSTPLFSISSGTTNLSLDAGMVIPVSINGTTWHDLNGDGVLDEGEPNLEGSTVILYDVNRNLAYGTIPQVVGPSGVWSFEGLTPGTYTAQIQPPSGEWVLSPIPEEDGNSTSTNFDPDSLVTNPVSLQSGESGEGSFDAGFYLPATVGDRVWFDENPDGIFQGGEPQMESSVTVKLYNSLGSLEGETQTTSGGFYEFKGLRPGTYEVEFILPSEDFQFTLMKVGDDNAFDSDANPKTGRAQVTLQSGQVNDDIDAGMIDANRKYIHILRF